MDLIAVAIEITDFHLKAGGAIIALVGVVILGAKYLPKLKGLFANVSLPSIGKSEDPRVCMMHDWDHFQAELLANGADAGKVEAFSNETVWPTIQKASKQPMKGIPEVAMDGKPFHEGLAK